MKNTHKHTEAITDVFLNQKRVNICDNTVKMASCDSFGKEPPGWVQDRKRCGVEGMEGKLNEIIRG